MTILLNMARFVAAGFGSGWLPGAPGTWGSLASLPAAWLLIEFTGLEGLAIATLIMLGVGCAACALVLPTLESDDPGWIVIDEWAGQWVSLVVIAGFYGLSLLSLLAAFLAFRLFDIFKPFPIRQLEHIGPSWWSIMADDLLAGVMGAAVAVATGTLLTGFL
ncbi:MAG: phosphatidylglycerophosphatase A [Mariprofundaceae bacterium]|nr:phosphatidylglycerophosphatase A [Mariprofundaceae bacterium]